jgi:hypothetical protein
VSFFLQRHQIIDFPMADASVLKWLASFRALLFYKLIRSTQVCIPLKLRNIAFDLLMGPGEGFQSLEKPKLAKVPGMLTKQKDGNSLGHL